MLQARQPVRTDVEFGSAILVSRSGGESFGRGSPAFRLARGDGSLLLARSSGVVQRYGRAGQIDDDRRQHEAHRAEHDVDQPGRTFGQRQRRGMQPLVSHAFPPFHAARLRDSATSAVTHTELRNRGQCNRSHIIPDFNPQRIHLSDILPL